LAASADRPEAEIVSYQEACLRHLVRHAYAKVPYYRQLLDRAGVDPRRIRRLRDLALIPATSREDIQLLSAHDLRAGDVDVNTLRVLQTSGSTGEPLVVRRTRWEEQLLLAYRVRAYLDLGWDLHWRRAAIDYYTPETLRAERRAEAHDRLGILPRLLIDWRTPKSRIIDKLARFRPQAVSGSPSILSWLADELTEEDRRRVPLRMVIPGAETLTRDMRRRIERGFGAPVGDVYGCHETVFLAMRGPSQTGHRVCRDAAIVEVLQDGKPVGPGESGEIVVTALHLFAMPFIRYRVGDIVRVGAVTGQGDSVSTLTSIDGRVMDRFFLPGGRVLHPYSLGDAIQDSSLAVRRFQVVQERRDLLEVRLVLPRYSGKPTERLERLKRNVMEILGEGMSVRLEVVSSLAPSGGGKFRPYVPVQSLRGEACLPVSSSHR
jgi:phenylacetate-CoA ligase